MDWLLNPVLLSLHIGAWTVALHLVLGVGLATYLSGEKSFLKGVVDLLVSIPIVFPPIALGLFCSCCWAKTATLAER